MTIILLLLVLLVLAAALAAAKRKDAKQAGRTATYRRRKLMTDNEEEFFGRLVVALPDHYIFPQVALSALLEPASSDRKSRRYRISLSSRPWHDTACQAC